MDHSLTKSGFIGQEESRSPSDPGSLRAPRPRPASSAGSPPSTTSASAFSTAISALFFFLVGGVEALLIRIQLAVPNNTFLSAQLYNELFTMHATTMIFLAVMPLGAAFFNYIMPLQIGARDVAFPRLNGFAYWVFLAARSSSTSAGS
jgi:heme/copper-type cytochrome/quinol oxidase subunit 1